jgi:hypothetical protein
MTPVLLLPLLLARTSTPTCMHTLSELLTPSPLWAAPRGYGRRLSAAAPRGRLTPSDVPLAAPSTLFSALAFVSSPR